MRGLDAELGSASNTNANKRKFGSCEDELLIDPDMVRTASVLIDLENTIQCTCSIFRTNPFSYSI